MPNLLLIAGNGRNVGKTTLACKIINYFAQATEEVIGLKISPHLHEHNSGDVIFKNDNFIITEELQTTSKDSSRMLQAGAKRVFYVMAKREFLFEVVEYLVKILPEKLIVCESGGLHEFVNPGLFLMVKRQGEEIVKTHLLNYTPIIINNDGENFDFDIKRLDFKNLQIKLNK